MVRRGSDVTQRESRILVAGATGQVGGLVARKLLAAGIPVRAVSRNPDKLSALAAAGAEAMAVNLLDRVAAARACEGVEQVFTSVNNVMGRGALSPNRVDLPAHDALCDAARGAGVRRLLYLSARGLSPDSPVDFFRVKHAIEERIRRSGVPYVLLRPGAFMETGPGCSGTEFARMESPFSLGTGEALRISSPLRTSPNSRCESS